MLLGLWAFGFKWYIRLFYSICCVSWPPVFLAWEFGLALVCPWGGLWLYRFSKSFVPALVVETFGRGWFR
jgi:hypothetical protein